MRKEQAMRREVIWFVAAAALAIAMQGVETAVAQQDVAQPTIDPAPADDVPVPELATDLPLPERSLVVEQPVDKIVTARDNSRPYFGVTFDPQVRNAAVARSVSAGSPADQAKVQAGDTIVSLNGQKIAAYDDALSTIARLKPGDVLDVEISRRVSVRTRAVLDGTPVGVEYTTGYRSEPESLPAPASYQNQPPVVRAPISRVPANSNGPRQPQRYTAPQNRNTNINRDGNSYRNNNSNDRDRDNRSRGGFFRRGRG
jgi:membrane-associated protease RseP (regulator of RpoE activity)